MLSLQMVVPALLRLLWAVFSVVGVYYPAQAFNLDTIYVMAIALMRLAQFRDALLATTAESCARALATLPTCNT